MTYQDRVVACRIDYQQLLDSIGLTEDDVQAVMTSTYAEGLLDVPLDKVEVRDSLIAGCGVYATRNITAHETIALGASGLRGTAAARYTNHSPDPNAIAQQQGMERYFVALQGILEGEEITVNYRQVLKMIYS